MTTHIFHADTHTHGLCNECERCQEHAEHPLASLDRDNLARIRRGELFTALDRLAAENLGEIADAMQRHPANGVPSESEANPTVTRLNSGLVVDSGHPWEAKP